MSKEQTPDETGAIRECLDEGALRALILSEEHRQSIRSEVLNRNPMDHHDTGPIDDAKERWSTATRIKHSLTQGTSEQDGLKVEALFQILKSFYIENVWLTATYGALELGIEKDWRIPTVAGYRLLRERMPFWFRENLAACEDDKHATENIFDVLYNTCYTRWGLNDDIIYAVVMLNILRGTPESEIVSIDIWMATKLISEFSDQVEDGAATNSVLETAARELAHGIKHYADLKDESLYKNLEQVVGYVKGTIEAHLPGRDEEASKEQWELIQYAVVGAYLCTENKDRDWTTSPMQAREIAPIIRAIRFGNTIQWERWREHEKKDLGWEQLVEL